MPLTGNDLFLVNRSGADYKVSHTDLVASFQNTFSGATPPWNPQAGWIWYDTTSKHLNVYNGTGWDVVSGVTVADAAPAGPSVDGDLWFDSLGGRLYIYYDDGNSQQWVDASPEPDLSSKVDKAGDTMTGALVLPADPTKPLEAATKQYVDRRPADGAINVLINGNLKVAQRASVAAGGGRNPLDVATVNVGEYGQDRWKKTAGGMTQIVEDGNYIPNVPYTLSAVGIATPVTANSPASGNWDISTTHGDLPVTARFIQMERGTIATDYELRSIGIEFLLCQRYFESMEVGAGVQGLPASSYFASAYSFAVPKRAKPTVFDRQAILNMGVVNAPISLLEPTLRGGRAQSRVTSTYGGGANCVQYEIISFDCDL